MKTITTLLFKLKAIIILLGLIIVPTVAFLILASPGETNKLHKTIDWMLESPSVRLAVRQKNTLKNKVVGTYELKKGGYTYKGIFQDNGVQEDYVNNKKAGYNKWKIVKEEVHIDQGSYVTVYKINPDGSLTSIYRIKNGKRESFPKEKQFTFKKIK